MPAKGYKTSLEENSISFIFLFTLIGFSSVTLFNEDILVEDTSGALKILYNDPSSKWVAGIFVMYTAADQELDSAKMFVLYNGAICTFGM